MQNIVIPCEVYSRVVGYFRPVHNWNNGKKQEYHERVTFTEEHSLANPKAKGTVIVSEMTEENSTVVDNLPKNINAYKIFTFPNCEKCEKVKSYLKNKPLNGSVIDLRSPEGNKEFRKYYIDRSIKENIKRMDDGTLKLPIVMFLDNESVVSTAQGLEETMKIVT
ncbi:MAG: anaerobic ribonucleoside-triphosphate reductase [Nanoarchaeota archaeon]